MKVNSDWSTQGRVADIEAVLSSNLDLVSFPKASDIAFRFEGTGMYLYPKLTILIVPAQPRFESVNTMWKKKWPADQVFVAHVYEAEHSDTIFACATIAPARVDER